MPVLFDVDDMPQETSISSELAPALQPTEDVSISSESLRRLLLSPLMRLDGYSISKIGFPLLA